VVCIPLRATSQVRQSRIQTYMYNTYEATREPRATSAG